MSEKPSARGSKKSSGVLVLQTAFLGDLLLSIPLLKNIRKLYPEDSITLICRKGIGQLLFELKVVDKFYEVEKGSADSYHRLVEEFVGHRFKLPFCPHESLRSAFFSRKLLAEKRIGFKSWWNTFFFDERIERLTKLPDALRQLSLLRVISAELDQKLKIYADENKIGTLGPVPEWASMNLNSTPDELENRICIFPGSVWATKRWRLEGFSEVGNRFSELGYEVILLGGKDERSLGDYIKEKNPAVKNLIGELSLIETFRILTKAKLVISNDSGGHHLAAAANVPIVSIFGPTVLEIGYRPWIEKLRIVQNNTLPCRPCGKHGHKACPIKTHECMKSISSDQVFQAAKELL